MRFGNLIAGPYATFLKAAETNTAAAEALKAAQATGASQEDAMKAAQAAKAAAEQAYNAGATTQQVVEAGRIIGEMKLGVRPEAPISIPVKDAYTGETKGAVITPPADSKLPWILGGVAAIAAVGIFALTRKRKSAGLSGYSRRRRRSSRRR